MKRVSMLLMGLALAALAGTSAMAADKGKGKHKFPPALPDPTQTECVLPFRPSVAISGASATEAQINALAERVKLYQHQLKKYRNCLEPKIHAAKDANNLARLHELDDTYNASVLDEQKVVAGYNAVAAAHERKLDSQKQAEFARCYLDQQEKMDPTKIYSHCLGQVAGTARG